MIKWLRYIGINGLFVSTFYLGYFEGVDGAANIAYFMAWVLAISGSIVYVAMAVDEQEFISNLSKRDTYSPVPLWFDVTFDIVMISLFVWFGHYVLGVFMVIALTAGYNMKVKLKEYTFDILRKPVNE